MTDLTEQWKKGEFIICNAGKCQYYYVQNEEQQEVIKTEYCLFDDNTPNWQILAPVPSYEEWQAKLEQNDKLKKLLKECVEVLNDAQRNYGYDDSIIDICYPIITKIDEVLK